MGKGISASSFNDDRPESMNPRLLNWLKENAGKTFDSPRKALFGRKPQGFTIRYIDEDEKLIRISFGKKRTLALPLYFWMFDRTLEYLSKNPETTYPIGARLQPPYPRESIEGEIWKEPKPYPSEYKAAPHVLDILALAGFAKFAYTIDRDTKRKVQGARYSSSEHGQPKYSIPLSPPITNSAHADIKPMEKKEILEWVKKHDKKNFWWIQQEKEIGDRLRKTKILSKDDLNKIIEWKFESNALVKTVQLNRMKKINEQHLKKVSNQVFNLDVNQDIKRIKLLCGFNGIGPAVASVILTFYDPENYCVVDFHVYQELFGFRPKFLTSEHYIRLLGRLREEAKKYNLRTRDVEKAYFMKNCETT